MALGIGSNKKKKDRKEIMREVHELISSTQVEQIRQSLIETNAELVVQGMLNKDARAKLQEVIKRDFKQEHHNNPNVIQYITQETIGVGVIEEILTDESITDVGYNGKELIVESNDRKQIFETNFEISDDYIVRLVNKFAHANSKDFTEKSPIFDGRFDNVRINAVHTKNTAPESDTTMSLRVVRPQMALNNNNFEGFAPRFILDFFKGAAVAKANMIISGTTGTGKTEAHKLISSFIPFDDRILLIEDTPETFMKEMFPEKDIYSWVTSKDVSVTEMIKAGLRNHPAWIMVTETRGQEAYEMIQAVLSGHSIITSLHATDARAIPRRFINMAKMGYEVAEEALEHDIRLYFNFGIHIKKVKYKGMIIRYLNEIIEFHPDGDKTIFKQRFLNGVFYFETHDVSDAFKMQMEESGVDMHFPAHFKSERILDSQKDYVTHEITIPLDANGRPDLEKIKAMGTSLEEMMGHYAEDDVSQEKEETKKTDSIESYARIGEVEPGSQEEKRLFYKGLAIAQEHDRQEQQEKEALDLDSMRQKVKEDMQDDALREDTEPVYEDYDGLDDDVDRFMQDLAKTDSEVPEMPDLPGRTPVPDNFLNPSKRPTMQSLREKKKPLSEREKALAIQKQIANQKKQIHKETL